MSAAQPKFEYSLNNDVRAVTAMAASLIPYIYEDELYGALPGTLPRLTVGGLIMRLNRLAVIRALLSPDQQKAVDEAQRQFDAARKEWPVAYEGKLQRELAARLQSLSQTIRDCAAEPRRCAEVYPSDIEKRVIVEGLQAEADANKALTPQQFALIRATDNQLRTYTQASDFIWDMRLQPAYPKDPYWYLYASARR